MTGYHITHIKDFMNKLLVSDIFDSFLLTEGTVVMGTSFVLDGTLKKDFFSPEEWEDLQLEKQKYSFWRSLRPLKNNHDQRNNPYGPLENTFQACIIHVFQRTVLPYLF